MKSDLQILVVVGVALVALFAAAVVIQMADGPTFAEIAAPPALSVLSAAA